MVKKLDTANDSKAKTVAGKGIVCGLGSLDSKVTDRNYSFKY